ncbi:META domain-containing protein [Pseudooceanicola batsensis]|nr:META domain-containing protein [Pseudooceanicola batsensis]
MPMRLLCILLALMSLPAAASDWTITAIDGDPAVGAPTISFGEDGISGATGCNRFSGSASASAGSLQIGPGLAMTRRACLGADLTAQEGRLTALLQGDVEMQPDPFDDSLTLVGNGVTARLVPGLPPPPVAAAAFLIVSGVEATLNVRRDASTRSGIVAHAPLGIILRNLGCEARSDRTWCRIGYIDASGLEGWAAAEYLAPASAIRRAGAELFDGIGRLDCRSGASEVARCEAGVARESDGSGAILIYLDDNRRLLLEFRGTSVAAAGADAGDAIATEVQEDAVLVTSGSDRITIPTAMLRGE